MGDFQYTKLLNLPRRYKRLVMLVADFLMVPLALWTAFVLRLSSVEVQVYPFLALYGAAVLIAIPVFIRLGLYRAVVRYMGPQAMLAVLKGVTLVTIGLMIITLMLRIPDMPRSVFAIFWLLAVFYVGGSRFFIRAYLHWLLIEGAERSLVAIYGAGAAGRQLASVFNYGKDYHPVCYLDDDKALQGTVINGLHVYGSGALEKLVSENKVTDVFLAMPSASRGTRQKIINRLEPLLLHVRTVPTMPELMSGKVGLDSLKDIDIDDLLGRDSVIPTPQLLSASVSGKMVMVTGAGGSIGSELCRQIVQLEPAKLLLFEVTEYALYAIDKELREVVSPAINVEVVTILGSVQDEELLYKMLEHYHVDVIFHAAAYKHVPLVEHNIISGVRNNVLGTLAMARAAARASVSSVILISTDKAVRPTNVMGATKRLAELVLQGLTAEYPETCFSMVRFGNVLGSSGSVVPLFRKQIAGGGPVTVTHPDIYRYFMTIPEAALLVVQAGALAKGGDVFVLDMGEPVNISDLARKMIHLMGFEVKEQGSDEGDIEIYYSGLRPGEKLKEELLIEGDLVGSAHPKILWAEENFMSWSQLQTVLIKLEAACNNYDYDAIKAILLHTLVGYKPDHEFVDGLLLQKRNALTSSVEVDVKQLH